MKRFVAFGIIFVLMVWPAFQNTARSSSLEARNGMLDLRGWDAFNDGPVALSGPWDFYWQTFLGPSPPYPEPDSRIRVPGVWNRTRINGTPIPGQGYATYRLRVILPDNRPEMGLKFLDAATAFTLFANGKKIYASGATDQEKQLARPGYRPGIAVLPVQGNTLDIVVHVSNWAHWQGGLWENITLGSLSGLTRLREHKIFFDALLFGSILIMGIYHLFLYRFRPQDPSTLYFGLFCLLVALRPLFHGERYLIALFPDLLPFSWFLKINYISFYLCVPLFGHYMQTLFPRQVSARVVRVISWAGLVAAATPLVLTTPVFTALMPWLQYATIAAVGYGCVSLLRAIRNREPEAGIFLAGFLIFFAAIVNDILYTRQFITTAHLVPLGLFSFILCQAILLARRFSLAFSLVNRQQQDLVQEMIQRNRVEQDLIESEWRFRTMADFMPVPLCETDVRLAIVYANNAALNWFGYTEEEMSCGLPLAGVFADVQVRNLAQLNRYLKQTHECLVQKKDGTRVWTQIEMSPILTKDHLTGHRICFIDLTERKKAEAASLHAAEQAKYILVGQVAGKMAHDFNNILSAVMGNAELSLMDDPPPSIRSCLEIILEQTRRGQMLTQNLVAFAKDQDPKEECLNLNEALDKVLNLMRRDLEGIAVEKSYGDASPDIMADPGMIEQCLVNIIQNAAHAMSRSENPILRVRTFLHNDFAGIEISDNGCGIPEAFHKEIYTPSFTLKGSKDGGKAYAPHIKGTGYGMANVKKYMDKHQGKISFTSVPGKGTSFILQFPFTEKTDGIRVSPVKPEIRGVRGKRILVVEDETAISNVFCNILTHPPFDNRITIAATGREAMDIFDRESFDLVSLDHMLPGNITGMEVYRHIRKTQTQIPIIFVSGNMEFIASIKKLLREDSCLAHLSKPCDNFTYARAVERWFQPEQLEAL